LCETVPFEAVAHAAIDPLIGRTIAAKYVIEGLVGRGGMGTVYRARQTALDKIVALKILAPASARDPGAVERFRQEARAASKLDHPASVRVLDFGSEPDGLLYIAMELVEGRDLASILEREGSLDPRRIATITGQILAALAAAHDRGIVHRDLKPENVLLTSAIDDDGEPIDQVKVCDFGIATVIAGNDAPFARSSSTATRTVIGTPDVMSPEQARGEEVDARSDLYSVGVLLYRLLTGRYPFVGETALSVAIQHVNAPVVPPSELVPDVDRGLEAICVRALEKRPEDRWPSARAMRAAVREVLDARRSTLIPTFTPRTGTAAAVALPAARATASSVSFTPPVQSDVRVALPRLALPVVDDDDLVDDHSGSAPRLPVARLPRPALELAATLAEETAPDEVEKAEVVSAVDATSKIAAVRVRRRWTRPLAVAIAVTLPLLLAALARHGQAPVAPTSVVAPR
jgi:serine/threonine-protein kinase